MAGDEFDLAMVLSKRQGLLWHEHKHRITTHNIILPSTVSNPSFIALSSKSI